MYRRGRMQRDAHLGAGSRSRITHPPMPRAHGHGRRFSKRQASSGTYLYHIDLWSAASLVRIEAKSRVGHTRAHLLRVALVGITVRRIWWNALIEDVGPEAIRRAFERCASQIAPAVPSAQTQRLPVSIESTEGLHARSGSLLLRSHQPERRPQANLRARVARHLC